MKIAPPTGNDLAAWARRATDDINRFMLGIEELPIYADDAAAAAGKLNVGFGYRTPDGQVRWRVS